MQQSLFQIGLICFLVGVAVQTLVPLSLLVAGWIAVIATGLFLLWRKYRSAIHAPLILMCAGTLLAFAIGVGRTEVYSEQFGTSVLKAQVGTKVTLQGVVIEEPQYGAKNQQVVIAVQNDKVLVSINAFSAISYGDEVSVTGVVTVPKSFETGAGRTFDYPHYLLAKRIEYTVLNASVSVLSHGNGNKFISELLQVKGRVSEGIETVIREPYASLGQGLLLGVKHALGKDIEDSFRTAGIIHIVVLSGYNIMLIVLFSQALLARVCARRVRIFIGMGLVISFALMVGLSATVVRASIMVLLLLTAELLHRTYNLWRSLLVAAAVMVCVSPYILLYDIGFQLSFMATLGLITIAPKLEELTAHSFGIKEYVIATLATQLAVFPLLLYYTGSISLVAIVTNVLVLPVVPLTMAATAVAGIGATLSYTLAVPAGYVAEWFLSYIISIAQLLAKIPFATTEVSAFPATYVLFSYAVMAGVLYWWHHRQHTAKSLVADWIIEAEETVQQKTALEGGTRAATDTPVFFR